MSVIDKIILNGTEYTLGGGSGLTSDVKEALIQIANKVVYEDSDGPDYCEALEDALYPPANLVSIDAVFTQGANVIYSTASLDTLKQYLVVTATYTDTTTATITSYTLSGSLTVGTSTITASYGGKSDTFTVTVTEYTPQSYSLSEPTQTGSANALGTSYLVDGELDLSGISEGTNRYYQQKLSPACVVTIATNASAYSLGYYYAVIGGELYAYDGSWHNVSQSESYSTMDVRSKSATTPGIATEVCILSRSKDLSTCTIDEVTGD